MQFCNLNLQWQDYRSKEPRQVAQEVALQQISTRFAVLFCRHVLNQADLCAFQGLQRLNLGLELFAEIVAATQESFREMRLAGMKQVQIGIGLSAQPPGQDEQRPSSD